jgi:hypothetical protein
MSDPPVIYFWKWIGWKDYGRTKNRNLESVSTKNVILLSPTACVPAHLYPPGHPTTHPNPAPGMYNLSVWSVCVMHFLRKTPCLASRRGTTLRGRPVARSRIDEVDAVVRPCPPEVTPRSDPARSVRGGDFLCKVGTTWPGKHEDGSPALAPAPSRHLKARRRESGLLYVAEATT